MQNEKSLRNSIANKLFEQIHIDYDEEDCSMIADQILDLVWGVLPERKPKNHVCADTYGNGFNEAIDTIRERLGMTNKSLKGKYIYWRRKKGKNLSKNYVQKDLGEILEITDSSWHTQYPMRILLKEIEIFKKENQP